MITDKERELAAAGASSFLDLGLHDFLEADTRPTFVLDIRSISQPQLRPVYVNKAFTTLEDLPKDFLGAEAHDSKQAAQDNAFYEWIISTTEGESYDFASHRWHRFDVHQSWRVLRSMGPIAVLNVSTLPSRSRQVSGARAPGTKPVFSARRSLDWTDHLPPAILSDHVKLFREHDWESTPMGPMHRWPYQLRNMLNMVMANPSAAAVFWGEDLFTFYNEGYSKVLANKHPSVIGKRMKDVWPEIWEQLDPIIGKTFDTAQATRQDDGLFFLDRGDWLEETYFTFTMVPLIGNDGKVCGLYNDARDVTRRVTCKALLFFLLGIVVFEFQIH